VPGDRLLAFHPLTVVADGSDIIVGRPDTDCFAAFPSDGAELLDRLRQGASPAAAGDWYRERFGESVDMAQFLETLRDLGFVDEGDRGSLAAPGGRRLGRAAFSPVAWLLYAALTVYALVLLVRHPGLRPHPADLFWAPSLVVTQLGVMLGQLPGLFFHEAMHVLAGRRLGVRTRLGVGHRLHMLVFETHLDGLWGVPRNARYLPLLAGLLGDLLWFSAMIAVAQAAGAGSLAGRFVSAQAFMTLLRIAWQFYVYLETDLYYVFVTAFGCVDLHRTVREYLRNRVRRLLRRPGPGADESAWHPRDRRVVRWYAVLHTGGYALTLGALAVAALPVMVRLGGQVATGLTRPAPLAPPFIDSCLILAMNLVPVAAVVVIALRRRRGRNAPRSRSGRP
jgi:hypothetical protein